MKPSLRMLFKPIRIGSMQLRNRVVMPPMGTNYAGEDGSVTERLVDYLEERAKGGVGLIIVENTSVDLQAKVESHQPSIHCDELIPSWRRLPQIVKRHGVKIAIQLSHGGREANSAFNNGATPVGPSPIPGNTGELPKELTVSEIRQIQARYVEAAQRTKAAGFDAVEIHAAHLYLIAQFLSAASNRRMDEYGGSVRNRARFLAEILRSIKEALGQDYPIICRINGREFGIENALTLQETQQIAQIAQNFGADAIHVSAQVWGGHPRGLPPTAEVPGNLLFLAEGIKKAVSIPVIAVGKITPELAEKTLKEGKTDLISFGRAFLADSQFLQKIRSGKLEDVRPCIGCFSCVHRLLEFEEPLSCMMNPALGREREFRVTDAERAKKVVVVGGGPAGMEAARVAALRGHEVTLYEKNTRLGGQLLLACRPPYKEVIESLTAYLAIQLKKVGVFVKLGKTVTPQLFEPAKADVVVLATGAVQVVPEIPGMHQDHVVMAWDVLAGKAGVGKTVVVIGGSMAGCETAEFLAEQGKEVIIVEILPEVANDMQPQVRGLLLRRLNSLAVGMMTQVDIKRISNGQIDIIDSNGNERTIEADSIVIAVGARPQRELEADLEGKISEAYLAGDCIKPRDIASALYEGMAVGLKI